MKEQEGKKVKIMRSKYASPIHSFNTSPLFVMHVDLNSCFASVEQQANHFLRGKPIAVAAYTTLSGCIIAPSIEAKRLGIKVGMRVKDGKLICPELIILAPDPWKYRDVHIKLKDLLSEYTPDITPKSIDEFVLDFKNTPLKTRSLKNVAQCSLCLPFGFSPLRAVALEIKKRIKEEIGDWLRVSIGIAPNRFLAKLASNFHKPDGLDEINKDNFMDCFFKLKLTDLPYIKERNAVRLNGMGIFSVTDFYNSPIWKLKAAFHSVNGYYWYLRLHGYEVDDVFFSRRSYSNSYALPKAYSKFSDLSPIVSKLTEKMSFRLRRAGFMAKGIRLALFYKNGLFWHKGMNFDRGFFASADIYKKVFKIFNLSPQKLSVRNVFVSVYNLKKLTNLQLNFFEDVIKKKRLSDAIDRVNERWGDFVIFPARMLLGSKEAVPDRIAFGAAGSVTDPRGDTLTWRSVKELEEFTMKDTNNTNEY